MTKTNLLICLIIVAGFLVTALLSYQANYSSSTESIEQVSNLASEGIYYQISNALAKPINISRTMANDNLLEDFLAKELEYLGDAKYMDTIRQYLDTYRAMCGYDSVFLVSAATDRYYNFNGLDRVLSQTEAEDSWYYSFLAQPDMDYVLNVDNDRVVGADNHMTLFVNCKIRANDSTVVGIVGVGVKIDYLQRILQDYNDKFNITAYFINNNGIIELSPEHIGYEKIMMTDVYNYDTAAIRDILNWKRDDATRGFWSPSRSSGNDDFIVVRYVPELDWQLVVEHNTGMMLDKIKQQLILTALVIAIIIGAILMIITHVMRSFTRQISSLWKMQEQERKTIFEKATGQLFDDIYDFDITNNRIADDSTAQCLAKFDIPLGASCESAVQLMAQKWIKPEFQQGYLDKFLPENVLRAFADGVESLSYDFMISDYGSHYYWMRLTARLINSEGDSSLHMLTYRSNIDAEKQREQRMQKRAQSDEMTGVLNKTATRRAIEQELAKQLDGIHAFFIVDIDKFKDANDLFGHSFGDRVICEFAAVLCEQFRATDLLGRIGGDEFVVFLSVPSMEWASVKAQRLNKALNREYDECGSNWYMSASIGVSFAPDNGTDFDTLYKRADAALYESKKRGRDSFTLYVGDEGETVE